MGMWWPLEDIPGQLLKAANEPWFDGVTLPGACEAVCYSVGSTMRKIHVRASVAAFVLFFVFTLHALQLDGQKLNRPSGRGKLRSCCPPAPKFYASTKSFAIGKEPRGIAFDGANLWVASRD